MPTEAELMRGGPGSADAGTAPVPNQGDPAPYDGKDPARRAAASTARPTQATARKVILAGVEYEVDPALAAALQTERDRVAGAYGSRLQQYERRLAALENQDDEPESPAPTALTPPDAKWLDATSDSYDPQRYHQANLDYQHALVEAGLQAVEDRRHNEERAAADQSQQQQNWNRNVNQFYQGNPSLRGKEDLVDAVWRANFAALKDLSIPDGFVKLAELSKARLVQLSEEGRRAGAPRQPRLETSATARANREPELAENEDIEPVVGGLSAAIKAKHRRFLNPDFKGKAA